MTRDEEMGHGVVIGVVIGAYLWMFLLAIFGGLS